MMKVMMMIHDEAPMLINPSGSCLHCGEPTISTNEKFCCHGCQTIHKLITSLGLKNYENRPAHRNQIDYEKLDGESFSNQFIKQTSPNACEVSLNIDGMHCYSCAWLIEKAVNAKDPGAYIKVGLSGKNAKVIFDPAKSKLSDIVKTIHSLGYDALPHTDGASSNHSELIAMGVSLFFASNLMMLALAEYLDVTKEMDETFVNYLHFFAFLMGTVCLGVGGRKILQTAWASLKMKAMHIDQPIAFGLVITYLYSTYEVFWGNGRIYYDSLATIIAFLMVGRFVQSQLLQKSLRQLAQAYDFDTLIVKKHSTDHTWDYVQLEQVQPGDRLELHPGNLVPLKCKMLTHEGDVYEEPLTGEIKSRQVKATDTLEAGLSVGSQRIEVEATEAGTDSSLLHARSLAQDLLSQEKGFYLKFADKMALVFFATLFLFSFGNFFLRWGILHQDFGEALGISISILLVACPCAFGLASTLVFSIASAKGFRKGVVFRNQRAMESLAEAQVYCFDKTGTLTYGSPKPTEEPDIIREDAGLIIDFLRDHHKEIKVLTGDSLENCAAIKKTLNLRDHEIFTRLTPENKLNLVRGLTQKSVMVGNGFNDVLAIAGAQIGVCVKEGSRSARESSDVFFTKPGLTGLKDAWEISAALKRTFRRCFGFALVYNLVVLSLAAAGFVSPLFAATLMPISSTMILLIATASQSS